MENIDQLINDLSDIFDNGAKEEAPPRELLTRGPNIYETAGRDTIDFDFEELTRARDNLCSYKPIQGENTGIIRTIDAPNKPPEYPEHSKHKIINEFIDAESSHGISQGSEEWHRRRAYGVGGSQIATIMGINTFTTLRKYVYEKLGLETRAGALRMWWGIIFEDVIAQYVEKIYNTSILGANMFIDRMPLYYSPDGLMVIDNEIVLLEFKSLYSRIPNKHVPEYYIPQPKMGLEIIKIADYALFVEAVFRRCRWDEMNSGKLFDKLLGQKNTGKYVLAYGFMLITRKTGPNDRWENGELIDYGTCGLELLEKMFYNACMVAPSERWSVKNSSVVVCGLPAFSHKLDSTIGGPKIGGALDDPENMKKLKIERAEMISRALEAGEIPIGIMPWKLIRADFHKITREPGYLAPYMEKITEFGKCIVAADQYPKDSSPEDIKRYKIDIAEKFLEKYDTGGETNDKSGNSYGGKYGGKYRSRVDNSSVNSFVNGFVNVDEYLSTLSNSDGINTIDNIDANDTDDTDDTNDTNDTDDTAGDIAGMLDFINFKI